MRFAILICAVAAVAAAQTDPYEHAWDLYTRADYDRAIAVLKQANPQDSRSLELLGRCYMMEADYRRAAEVLERTVALDPGSSMANLWLGRAYGRRAETSFAFSSLSLAGKARQSFQKAVQLDPNNREALDDLFAYYLDAPGFAGGGIDKARSLLPLIERSDPTQYDFDIARIALASKQYSAAEAAMRRAIAAAPRQIGHLLELAKFLSGQGRFEESEATFRRAESVAPGSPRILYARAEADVQSKRNLVEARDLLKKYLAESKLTPDDPSRADALSLLKKAEGG
jgi:tetratricopeptide (TPR) repeat protein